MASRFNLTSKPDASHCPAPLPGADWKRWFRRRLMAWYDRHARELPWRRRGDAYAVWVSEIMLQQTQVVTVAEYFPRFLAAFPTLSSLAAADEQQVLRIWEGLGYYRRARQMHRAAKIIARDHAGRFPRELQAVRSLPGIGRYTAGAILSIAFDARQPILEANTQRLLCRLLAYDEDPCRGAGQRFLWSAAADWLPRKRVGRFNQALMELGSLVCTPRAPCCDVCPVARRCPTRAAERQDEIPVPAARPKVEKIREAAVVVKKQGRLLLVQCGSGKRWAGLWDFPRFPLTATRGNALRRELIAKVADATGIEIDPLGRLTTLHHGVTRFRITLTCHEARYVAGRLNRQETVARWVRPEKLDGYPLNVTGRKLCRLITDG